MERLRKHLPKPEHLQQSPWLKWLGPTLFQPRLWHVSRRGLAMGMALGMFFGLLVPIAQVPLSAAAAVVLRANVPAAIVSTMVTNPVTFGPIYYGAWRLGTMVLGRSEARYTPQDHAVMDDQIPAKDWWSWFKGWVSGVGKPLVLGLALLACGVGLLTYYLVSLVWVLRVRRKRRLRQRVRK
ncbi:MAG: DUF2062 domain-containing protein [Aquabacterium sp.]